MNDIKRVPAGVMFESDALAFVDSLAFQNQKSRSVTINVIIRAFMKQQMQNPKVEEPKPAGTIRF